MGRNATYEGIFNLYADIFNADLVSTSGYGSATRSLTLLTEPKHEKEDHCEWEVHEEHPLNSQEERRVDR